MIIESFYCYPFDSCKQATEFILSICQYEASFYPNVQFSQATAFFSQNETEREFVAALAAIHPRPLVILEEDKEPPYSDKIMHVSCPSEHPELAANLLSHIPVRPERGNGWDGLTVLRKPISVATALLMSAYARSRNLFLVTTVIDVGRNNQLAVNWGSMLCCGFTKPVRESSPLQGRFVAGSGGGDG